MVAEERSYSNLAFSDSKVFYFARRDSDSTVSYCFVVSKAYNFRLRLLSWSWAFLSSIEDLSRLVFAWARSESFLDRAAICYLIRSYFSASDALNLLWISFVISEPVLSTYI